MSERIDVGHLHPMFQATAVANAAARLAREARNSAYPPELPEAKVYRFIIGEDDGYYTGTMDVAKMPEALVGLIAFARKIVIPVVTKPESNDVLALPLVPNIDGYQHNKFRDQHGALVQRIGLGWTALQKVEIVPWGDAREELDYYPHKIFHPRKRY